MTISRRLALGYGVISVGCLLATGWLGYHEFVEEPAEFSSLGLTDLVHKDTRAEAFTVGMLVVVPLLLAYGWWWTRRVLAPLRELAVAAERIESDNLCLQLPRSTGSNEVDTLAAVLANMTTRLDASFQQMREFTLHASHELKTPLTVMRAQLESLHRERGNLPPEQNSWIEQQLDEVARLAKIVDSLTLLTKADAGLMKLEREEVDFRALVFEAFENAAALAESRAISVAMGDVAPVKIVGDRHRLRQLLLILIDNAVKYNRPGGSIQLASSAGDGWVELLVTNEGDSLNEDVRHRVFDRFFRGDNAIGKVAGCGIGLTIARWIALAHEGRIELRPGPPGSITACLWLPTVWSGGASSSHALRQDGVSPPTPAKTAPGFSPPSEAI